MKKYIILSALLCVAISCENFSNSIKETFEPSPKATASNKNEQLIEKIKIESSKEKQPIAESIEALERAESQLRNLPQFKNEEIMIFSSVHFFSNGRIILEIQDPKQERNIDKYTYRNGKWEDPEPVIISVTDEIEPNTIDLKNAPFKVANKVYQTLQEKANEINIDPPKTIYFIVRNGKVNWYPTSLRTDRSQYKIAFDSEGNLLTFEQN